MSSFIYMYINALILFATAFEENQKTDTIGVTVISIVVSSTIGLLCIITVVGVCIIQQKKSTFYVQLTSNYKKFDLLLGNNRQRRITINARNHEYETPDIIASIPTVSNVVYGMQMYPNKLQDEEPVKPPLAPSHPPHTATNPNYDQHHYEYISYTFATTIQEKSNSKKKNRKESDPTYMNTRM